MPGILIYVYLDKGRKVSDKTYLTGPSAEDLRICLIITQPCRLTIILQIQRVLIYHQA